jgi:hypothetical protein
MGRLPVICFGITCLSSCTFRAADVPADAPLNIDASEKVCHLRLISSLANSLGDNQVGGGGGGSGPELSCPVGQLPIGYAFDMSKQKVFGVGESAVSVTQTCATITIDAKGVMTTVPSPTSQKAAGNGNDGWSPFTMTAVTRCPTGSVPVGMRVSTGGNGRIFRYVTVRCRTITNVAATGPQSYVTVDGTLSDLGNGTEATCDSGAVVSSLKSKVGSGLDSLLLHCERLECAP